MKRIYKSLLLFLSLCAMLCCFSFFTSAADLSAPKVTSVKAGDTTVTISWKKIKSAYGYRVYQREPGGKFTSAGTTRETEITVDELSPDTSYEFRIRAFVKDEDGSKDFGKYTEVFTALTKLRKPSKLAFVSATADSITVSWKKVKGAEYYEVLYGIAGKDGYTSAGTTEKTSLKIKNLSNEHRYKIKVIAKKKGNRSPHSSLIRLFTLPPRVKTPEVVSKDGASVTIKWDNAGRANLYYVYVSSSADGKFRKVAETADNQFTYEKKKPKAVYYFKIVPLISTDHQLSEGKASKVKKAAIGNITIETPKIIRKGEFPEFNVPYYNDKVKWSTSDKSVIKITDSGLYAVGKGEVTITAKYKDFKAKATVKVTDPAVNYMAAVYDITADKYVFKHNARKRCYPASITKLITALVALKYMDENDTIVVGSELNMVETYSSRCDIRKGEKYKLRDLLYGLLLPSGGDAAYTIAVNCARKVSGKPDMGYVAAKNYFVGLMNKYMESIGATGTHCVNPHGYPVSGHYSTVHDLVLVAKKVLKNDTLKKITSTSYKYVKALTGQGHSWGTTNSLIASYAYYYYPEAHGMKTGTVNDEYTGIISAATKDGRTIVTVVIGCESYNARYIATHKLLNTYL